MTVCQRLETVVCISVFYKAILYWAGTWWTVAPAGLPNPAVCGGDMPIRREQCSVYHVVAQYKIFDLEKLSNEENYRTVGGFVMSQVRSIPSVGQRFEWGKLCFEVVDMDRHRVDKALVMPVQAVLPDSEE